MNELEQERDQQVYKELKVMTIQQLYRFEKKSSLISNPINSPTDFHEINPVIQSFLSKTDE